jgi:hypothetical protein
MAARTMPVILKIRPNKVKATVIQQQADPNLLKREVGWKGKKGIADTQSCCSSLAERAVV